MNKISRIILFGLSIMGYVYVNGQYAQEIFLQANQAYAEKIYDKALSLYQAIDHKGPAVWYNMGNCYYRKDQYAQALACWRRAQKRASQQVWKRSEFNCSLVENQLIISIDHTFGQRVLAVCAYLFDCIALLWFQLLFLCVWSLMVMSIWLYKYRYRWVSIVLIGLIVISGSMLSIKYYLNNREVAIVVIDNSSQKNKKTILYAGPDVTYHEIGSVNYGQEVYIDERQGSWYKVHTNVHKGWISADAIEII